MAAGGSDEVHSTRIVYSMLSGFWTSGAGLCTDDAVREARDDSRKKDLVAPAVVRPNHAPEEKEWSGEK